MVSLYNKFLNYTIFRLGQGKIMWFKMCTSLNHGVLCSIHMIQRILKNKEHHWTYLPICITKVEYLCGILNMLTFIFSLHQKMFFVPFEVAQKQTFSGAGSLSRECIPL